MRVDASKPNVAITPVAARSGIGLRQAATLLDRAIGIGCEGIGAGPVLAGGVLLFLWLSMRGMVVALRNDGHMRLTTVANWVPDHWAQWFSAVASLVVIAFVLEILLPAAEYLDQQRFVQLISLEISDGYRVVALLVGAGLAAVIALLRLLETTTVRSFSLA